MAVMVRDLREELLARHAELRAAVAGIRVAVAGVREGTGTPAELQLALAELAETVRVHCAHEDEVLRGVIVSVDAWGDARAELLSAAHAHERREVEAAIRESTATDDAERLFDVTIQCVERLLEHFAREERFVLAEDVLCDGIIARNSFCG